jgi:hypothetical protein
MNTLFRHITYIFIVVAFIFCSTSNAQINFWIERGVQNNTMMLFIDLGVPVKLDDARLQEDQQNAYKMSNVSFVHPVYLLQYNASDENLTMASENLSGEEMIGMLPGAIESGRLAWLAVLPLSQNETGTGVPEMENDASGLEKPVETMKSRCGDNIPQNPMPGDCFEDRWCRIICV